MAGGEKRLANAYLLEIIRMVPRLAREFEDPILMMSMAFTITVELSGVQSGSIGECQSGAWRGNKDRERSGFERGCSTLVRSRLSAYSTARR
jgi:hypothetical protein